MMTEIIKCKLCNCNNFKERNGKIRSNSSIKANKILECLNCSLVFLNDDSHISESFYEESSMDSRANNLEEWRLDTFSDDLRRYDLLKHEIKGSKIIDVGSGNGNFVKLCSNISKEAYGLEIEEKYHKDFQKENLKIFSNRNEINFRLDLVVTFHVIEHVDDPIKFLQSLLNFLKPGGKLYIETPNSNDALLKLYNLTAFKNFIYWDNHLILFNYKSFEYLCNRFSGIKFKSFPVQRYGVSNHLYWLINKKPGGNKIWKFLGNKTINNLYKNFLYKLGMNDTLFYQIVKIDNTSLNRS